MSGRSPARLLAPIALVLFAIAFFAVLGSGGGGEREEEADRPAATQRPTTTTSRESQEGSGSRRGTRTYTVKAGDTPSSIAEKEGTSLQELTNLNPEMDANTLQPGQKLKLPR